MLVEARSPVDRAFASDVLTRGGGTIMSHPRNRGGLDLLFMPYYRRAIFHCPRKRTPDVAITIYMPCSFKISSASLELVSRTVRDVVKAFVRGSCVLLRVERAYRAQSVDNSLR